MVDKSTQLTMIAVTMTVIFVIFTLAMWLVIKMSKTSQQRLSPVGTDVIVVSVRRLKRTLGFMGYSENGLSPRLEIAPDGLRFKVFKPDHWPFADIAGVDVPWVMFGTRLEVRNRSNRRLYIYLHNEAAGRDFLRALPPEVPLMPRAINLRDGIK